MMMSVAQMKVWKTIKLGLRKSPEEYRKALLARDYHIGAYANEILDNIPISQEEFELDLVCLTDQQLRFEVVTRQRLIYQYASEFDLQKCPAEVGPALREQFHDQRFGGRFLIGMDPILSLICYRFVFSMNYDDDGLWISTEFGSPDI